MSDRSQPWQIAADLEKAWIAVHEAEAALDAIHLSAIPEVEAISGTEFVNSNMVSALRALSDKYQAIADAEPDERAADDLRTGFREEDFA